MTEFLLILAVCVAAGWLGLSTYLGLLSLQQTHLHAHQATRPDHHYRYLAG